MIEAGTHRSLGVTSCPTYNFDLGRSIWSVYPTTSILINRLLRPAVYPGINLSPRGQKIGQVKHLPFLRCRTADIPLSSKNSTYYVCTHCQSFYEQPLGKTVTTVHEGNGSTHHSFKTHSGPPVGDRCPECNSTLHVSFPYSCLTFETSTLTRISPDRWTNVE